MAVRLLPHRGIVWVYSPCHGNIWLVGLPRQRELAACNTRGMTQYLRGLSLGMVHSPYREELLVVSSPYHNELVAVRSSRTTIKIVWWYTNRDKQIGGGAFTSDDWEGTLTTAI